MTLNNTYTNEEYSDFSLKNTLKNSLMSFRDSFEYFQWKFNMCGFQKSRNSQQFSKKNLKTD